MFWSLYGPDLFFKIYSKIESSNIFLNYCLKLHGSTSCTFNMLSATQRDFFFQNITNKDKIVVLELGYGPGGLATEVGQLNNCEKLIGVDFSGFIPSKYPSNVHFFKNDLGKIVFEPNQFDLIYCVDSFYHVQKRERLLKRILEALKKNGEFILFISFTNEQEKNNFLESIVKLNVQTFDFTEDDREYWANNATLLKAMESDFKTNYLSDVYSMREKEMEKFMSAHNRQEAARFCFVFKN